MLAGRGESQRVMQVGLSEAAVLMRKIASFGDPRLFAVNEVAERLAHSQQPLVPERLFIAGGNGHSDTQPQGSGLLGLLISLLVAEKSGFQIADTPETADLRALADRWSKHAMRVMEESAAAESPAVPRVEGHGNEVAVAQ